MLGSSSVRLDRAIRFFDGCQPAEVTRGEMIATAQDRRSHGWPVGGAGHFDAVRRSHRRGADRPGLRRLAAVRRPRRRPGPAPVAHRRRVPGAARPLRRGRLHPGAARAAGHPLHRLGRARLGAGDEQGARQGGVPAQQPADRPRLRASQSDSGEDLLELHGVVRLPGRRQARAAKGRRWGRGSRATSWSWRPPSRTPCASTTTCWSSGSSRARRSRSAILDGKPLGAVEIVPKRGFYDFHNKYTGGRTDYHLPARLSPERYRSVLRLATLAHEALGCEGATRVDLIVSERGNEVILEINTLPGMTPTSLLPKIAHGAGLSFEDLVEEMLQRRAPARARPPARSTRGAGRLRRDPSAAPASCPTRTSRSAPQARCATISFQVAALPRFARERLVAPRRRRGVRLFLFR